MNDATTPMREVIQQQGGTIEPLAPDDELAIVEVMGHRRHVGRILEVERFGTKMLRVDVPNGGDFAKGYVSHFYGGQAIFCITPTDLPTVKRANGQALLPGRYSAAEPEGEDHGEFDC